jgi:uncharacterized repeat protein (TIGR03803 family)
LKLNAIALLSNFEWQGIDPSSPNWLGLQSDHHAIRESGIQQVWNGGRVNSSGIACLGAALIFWTACGGNSGKATPPTIYTISGSVTGLAGSGLVLQNNGENNLTVNGNGSFLFSTVFAIGSAYDVTVLTQPSSPTQNCAIKNGQGTATSNVTDVQVTCGTIYTIGGTVTGLEGTGMVLQNNNGDNLPLNANVSFTFSTPVTSGGPYNVTVLTQPSNPVQSCAVTNGNGTANANVTNIQVICSPNYTIGGTVTGLTGTGMVLQNNNGDNLTVNTNEGVTFSFTFSTPVASGAPYSVTILTQPSNPVQTCAVTNGSGTANGNITNVQVACTANLGTLTTLYSFCQNADDNGNCLDGADPSGVVQGQDGNFYGTTVYGGGNVGQGTIFQYTSQPSLNGLWNFCQTDCSDGSYPEALVQGSDGMFYGTTVSGGAHSNGVIFQMYQQSGTWTLTPLWSFCSQTYANGNCTDGTDGGYQFDAPLVQGSDGAFYGTKAAGGANQSDQCYDGGCGTVFKIAEQNGTWNLTTLYSFCATTNCADGLVPEAGLVQGADGNFYGTTFGSPHGSGGVGTVFEITPTGTLTTLYTFCSQTNCTDGANPAAGLVQATDGNFYGTTYNGGASNSGTVFKITPTGALTTLYSFCSLTNCTDGANPAAGLMQASDGNFYGTTLLGGNGYGTVYGGQGAISSTPYVGTVFRITPAGELTKLYSFCSVTSGDEDCFDGEIPDVRLIQATDGLFYGTTESGGISPNFRGGEGTLFSLAAP